MPERARASAEVIADRYLTSPSRLRERPFGPVDALDTHAGRASQVRIVFVPGDWDEAELSEAVARWCGIGQDGVTGILDYGQHAGRWFVVLPPSLGISIDRWRTMRRPTAAEAARLTLAFARLIEAVGASGFPPDIAEVGDFAVAPGPTAFLEQPLLTPPGAPSAITRRAAGQQLLAGLLRDTCAAGELPPAIAGWCETAAAGEHPSLGASIEALRTALEQTTDEGPVEPVGLSGVFDRPYQPQARRRRPANGNLLMVFAALATLASLLVTFTGGGDGPAPATAAPAAARSVPVARTHRPAAGPAPAPARPATPHRHGRKPAHRPRRRPAHHRPAHAPSRVPPAAPATHSPSGSSGTRLPSPGGLVLPAP